MDIAIDFSDPSAAFQNIYKCLENDIPVISGTTGWLSQYDEVVEFCNFKKGAFIYASNFSLGVNLFFNLNEYLSKIMKNMTGYNIEMEEIHHIHKVDAPSGTAITLAESIIDNSTKMKWNLKNDLDSDLFIKVKREGEVPGTHIVEYKSDVDTIEIRHTAINRGGFALGAVIAAEWLLGKTGIFTMKDVLNI